MLVYDINTYLENDTTLKGLFPADTVDIQPMVGAEGTNAPYILYWIYPHVRDVHSVWFRKDIIKYEVWDTDVDRCINIGERVIKLLNIPDELQLLVSNSTIHVSDAGVIPKYSYMTRGTINPPPVKQGWFSYRIQFELGWIA